MARFESKGTWFEGREEIDAAAERQAFQASFAGALTRACACCSERPADPERFQQRGIKRCDRCWRHCPLGGAHVAARGPQKWCAVCHGEGEFCQHCCLLPDMSGVPCACGTGPDEPWHNPGCELYPEGGYPADQPWRGPPKR